MEFSEIVLEVKEFPLGTPEMRQGVDLGKEKINFLVAILLKQEPGPEEKDKVGLEDLKMKRVEECPNLAALVSSVKG